MSDTRGWGIKLGAPGGRSLRWSAEDLFVRGVWWPSIAIVGKALCRSGLAENIASCHLTEFRSKYQLLFRLR